ncbi:hypothetical protein, partial [Klebsiella pneumoniae]
LNPGLFIKQWYLQETPLIRLRSAYDIEAKNGIWTMTLKGKGLLSRPEVNIKLLDEEALEVLDIYSEFEVPFLQKTRHCIDIGNEDRLICELDH